MTRPGPAVRAALLDALDDHLGYRPSIRSWEDLGGGPHHRNVKVITGGEPIFLKWSDRPNEALALEAELLGAIRAAGEPLLRIPRVIGRGTAPAFLCLEWVDPAAATGAYADRLGRGLAALHRARSAHFGWERDGWIGALPQPNPSHERWDRFWEEARLRPQLRRATDGGLLEPAEIDLFERVIERLPTILEVGNTEGPSLLHGDLWSGNAFPDRFGHPVLFDPASCFGHREVDLAMSELFGGFPRGFRQAYESEWPLRPGYDELRRPAYQMYYLLVHLNLFGEGYRAATIRSARKVLSAL